jgi:HSP20 family protein
MKKEMARLLDELEEKELPWRFKPEPFSPTADIGVAHGEVYVNIQVPGACKEDLTLQLFEGKLIIKGMVKEINKEDKPGYKHKKKDDSGHFSREIPLPANLDVERARALLDRGILRVRIPKLTESEKSAVTVPIE